MSVHTKVGEHVVCVLLLGNPWMQMMNNLMWFGMDDDGWRDDDGWFGRDDGMWFGRNDDSSWFGRVNRPWFPRGDDGWFWDD